MLSKPSLDLVHLFTTYYNLNDLEQRLIVFLIYTNFYLESGSYIGIRTAIPNYVLNDLLNSLEQSVIKQDSFHLKTLLARKFYLSSKKLLINIFERLAKFYEECYREPTLSSSRNVGYDDDNNSFNSDMQISLKNNIKLFINLSTTFLWGKDSHLDVGSVEMVVDDVISLILEAFMVNFRNDLFDKSGGKISIFLINLKSKLNLADKRFSKIFTQNLGLSKRNFLREHLRAMKEIFKTLGLAYFTKTSAWSEEEIFDVYKNLLDLDEFFIKLGLGPELDNFELLREVKLYFTENPIITRSFTTSIQMKISSQFFPNSKIIKSPLSQTTLTEDFHQHLSSILINFIEQENNFFNKIIDSKTLFYLVIENLSKYLSKVVLVPEKEILSKINSTENLVKYFIENEDIGVVNLIFTIFKSVEELRNFKKKLETIFEDRGIDATDIQKMNKLIVKVINRIFTISSQVFIINLNDYIDNYISSAQEVDPYPPPEKAILLKLENIFEKSRYKGKELVRSSGTSSSAADKSAYYFSIIDHVIVNSLLKALDDKIRKLKGEFSNVIFFENFEFFLEAIHNLYVSELKKCQGINSQSISQEKIGHLINNNYYTYLTSTSRINKCSPSSLINLFFYHMSQKTKKVTRSIKDKAKLELSIQIDYEKKALNLTIYRAKNLPKMDVLGAADAYVKVQMVPDNLYSHTENNKIRNFNFQQVYSNILKKFRPTECDNNELHKTGKARQNKKKDSNPSNNLNYIGYSKIINNNLNPIWNQTISCKISEENMSSTFLNIEDRLHKLLCPNPNILTVSNILQ